MKKIVSLSMILLMLISLTACGKISSSTTVSEKTAQKDTLPNKAKGKILIAYFSQARLVSEGADAVTSATPFEGNTASTAYKIQKITGGDIFEINTVNVYPVDHKECSKIVEQEQKEDARPTLATHVDNMDSYDIIFLGYPIWWYIEPMAIRTFLEEYDFSGKTIIPFSTSLSIGIEKSMNDITKLCPNSTILNGITLRTGQKDMSKDIAGWLKEIGLRE